MRKLIQVKRKHIRGGKPADCKLCAVALAFKDVGLKVRTIGNWDAAFWNDDGRYIHCTLPRSAQRFISRFDRNKSACKPINFYIDVPEGAK